MALPCRFQFVAQHERQLATLNGKPLVQRIRPAIDQSPISWLTTLLTPPPKRLPWPNGSSASQLVLIWWRTSKSDVP